MKHDTLVHKKKSNKNTRNVIETFAGEKTNDARVIDFAGRTNCLETPQADPRPGTTPVRACA